MTVSWPPGFPCRGPGRPEHQYTDDGGGRGEVQEEARAGHYAVTDHHGVKLNRYVPRCVPGGCDTWVPEAEEVIRSRSSGPGVTGMMVSSQRKVVEKTAAQPAPWRPTPT